MQENNSLCLQRVGDRLKCPFCDGFSIKYGKNRKGEQRYQCKVCSKTFLRDYIHQAYVRGVSKMLVLLLRESCGIRSISRLLKIGVNTVLRRIRDIAKQIKKPLLCMGKEYELDELCTHVKSKAKKRRIVYAIRKDTKEVVDFSIGSRTNNTLKRVVDTLLLSSALKVFTDKLPSYKYLLPDCIHSTKYRGTDHIERKNVTLRTHLKRLSRRTICFSRSESMLSACLKIYFWG